MFHGAGGSGTREVGRLVEPVPFLVPARGLVSSSRGHHPREFTLMMRFTLGAGVGSYRSEVTRMDARCSADDVWTVRPSMSSPRALR